MSIDRCHISLCRRHMMGTSNFCKLRSSERDTFSLSIARDGLKYDLKDYRALSAFSDRHFSSFAALAKVLDASIINACLGEQSQPSLCRQFVKLWRLLNVFVEVQNIWS